jgi:ribosomal protein S18 acetylase RimI-like enzyme
MFTVSILTELKRADLHKLIVGYTSDAKYRMSVTQHDAQIVFTLALTPLSTPYIKRFDPLDDATLMQYQRAATLGYSFGAYDGEQCVGIALAEPHVWNKSLWVHEFHVAATQRGQGVGRQLMDALVQKASSADLRTIVCETQNTNAPAIHFYQRLGFRIEGVDLSYYANDDYPDGEIALFMKKPVV